MGLLSLSQHIRALDTAGDPVPGARRFIYEAQTDVLSPLFSDSNITFSQANPMVADTNGDFPRCYLTDGRYRIVTLDKNGVQLSLVDDVVVSSDVAAADKVFQTVEALLGQEELSYDETAGTITAVPADVVTVKIGGFSYTIADPAATDAHLTTAGGVKLYVNPGPYGLHVKAFGAVGDGIADDTQACRSALAAAGDNGSVELDGTARYRLTDSLDTSGIGVGKQIRMNGSVFILDGNSATIQLGQQGSGLFMDGGEIRAQGTFTGAAITLLPQARSADAARSCFLVNGNINCVTSTGTAVLGEVVQDDTRIVGLRVSNISVSGFEYGMRLRSAAPSGVGFINDNEVTNFRLPGRTTNGIHIETATAGVNEVSGNKFTNLMTQYFAGSSVRHICLQDERCKRNKFVAYDAWDIGGANTLLVEDNGLETMWLATIPTSGGVASFSETAIGMFNTDSGSQVAEIRLGDYRRSSSVERRKVQTYDTGDLPSLSVWDGDVLVEGSVVSGTRLTHITNAGIGQTITVIFGGNTLLSNGWGGVGQILTRNGSSRYPAQNEVSQFTFTGSHWMEHGVPESLFKTATATQLGAIAASVNTNGKFAGKLVWDTTNNRMLRSSGGAATSHWHVVDGSSSIIPS